MTTSEITPEQQAEIDALFANEELLRYMSAEPPLGGGKSETEPRRHKNLENLDTFFAALGRNV